MITCTYFYPGLFWSQPEWADAAVHAAESADATAVETIMAAVVIGVRSALSPLIFAMGFHYLNRAQITLEQEQSTARREATQGSTASVEDATPARSTSPADLDPGVLANHRPVEDAHAWARRVFQAADTNGDGKLSHREIKKYLQSNPADKQTLLGPSFHWDGFFKAIDENGDGYFDADEFTGASVAIFSFARARAPAPAPTPALALAVDADAAKTAAFNKEIEVINRIHKIEMSKLNQKLESAEGALEDQIAEREKENDKYLFDIQNAKADAKKMKKRDEEASKRLEEMKALSSRDVEKWQEEAAQLKEDAEEASKRLEEKKEEAAHINDDLKKARTCLLIARSTHRHKLKELYNSEAYLASKYLSEKLRELHDATTSRRRGRRRAAGAGGSLRPPNSFSFPGSPRSPQQCDNEGDGDGDGGGGPLVPYSLRVSSVKDVRIAGIYVHSNAHHPEDRFYNGRPYFERYGSGEGTCFLSFDLVLERWVFGSGDPLGESNAAELYVCLPTLPLPIPHCVCCFVLFFEYFYRN